MSDPTRPKSAAKSKRRLSHPTWEHPKGSGIKIAEMPNKTGGVVYGYSYQIRIPGALLGKPGQREFHQRKTKIEAERFAEDRLTTLRTHGTRFSDLPPAAHSQALAAWGILSKHGIGFVEAAETAVRVLRPAGGVRTVSEVLDELRKSKQARFERKELRAKSWDDYRSRSVKIADALGSRPINLVTQDDIAAWLRKLGAEGLGDGPLGTRSVKNYRACVSELFGYAFKKRYCPENPMARFTREELSELGGQKNKRGGINVLTIAEAETLLKAARSLPELGLLPSVILRLFCGLRTEEIVRADWHDVRWQEPNPFVHISEDNAKGRAARNVTIPANALEWIALCPAKTGRISPRKKSPGYCRLFRRLCKHAGMGAVDAQTNKWKSTWETNDTRHSFGSYHFALHGNSILTATEMGHRQGDAVLFNNYRKLTTKSEGERYFSIRPDPTPAEVTVFSQATA